MTIRGSYREPIKDAPYTRTLVQVGPGRLVVAVLETSFINTHHDL